MIGADPNEKAYIAPLCVFLLFLLLAELVRSLGDGYAHWALAEPRYWVFPLQTAVCAATLWRLRKRYTFGPYQGFGFATAVGLLALAVWIAPQWLLGAAPRIDGFNPEHFGTNSPVYLWNLGLRLVRMVVIVPLVEEIFWRGFLLRYLVNEDFCKVPFGTFTWRSFSITSAAFCLEHQFADWPAALVTGALFNIVAWRTRSLAACVITHAITNLFLAFYILETRQWGFW